MKHAALLFCLIVSAAIPFLSQGQQTAKTSESAKSAANAEMARLAKVLAGDWDTAESMEKSQFFPNGGSRRGIAHVRLTAGGTTLINQVNSDGPAGPLNGLVVIWWDGDAKLYRFFTCFKGDNNPCRVRGTAHWEGDTFVNYYEEIIDGKVTKWRDSWIHITPKSHTLVAAMDFGNGTMKTFITSTGTRR
jgi:hypothetical protein